MSGFIKIGDFIGEATDLDHKEWVLMESMTFSIHRSVSPGVKDMERARGETTLGDIVVVRHLDKSSAKLQEACATGMCFEEVELQLCTTIHRKQEPYLIYKLKNVIVTSYSFHGTASGNPLPTETLTFGFTEMEWTYMVLAPETGDKVGEVPGKYAPGTGKGG